MRRNLFPASKLRLSLSGFLILVSLTSIIVGVTFRISVLRDQKERLIRANALLAARQISDSKIIALLPQEKLDGFQINTIGDGSSIIIVSYVHIETGSIINVEMYLNKINDVLIRDNGLNRSKFRRR